MEENSAYSFQTVRVRNSFKEQKEEQMADKYNDKTKKYDEQHSKRLASIERKIKAAYKKASEDASKLATAPHLNSKKTYRLNDYPQAKKQADRIIEELQESVENIIVNGIESEWTLANNKNNELSRIIFGDNVGSLTDEQYQRYFSNNHEALQAFITRKQAGMNLSDRVWKYTGSFKDEIETAIDLGIRYGKSAAEISRNVRSYLQNPDKLFRKVKDEYGKLHLSKAAKTYHPGNGVYRSSYMNARRLAVTETNIAYRTADYIRQQQLDFIVGIRIVLSNNHNCKGVPAGMFFDICDSLQGNYPKDFKFTGWHPHCRCHVETILKTPEELETDTERILAGRQPTDMSKNKIKDVPKAFKEWVKDNEDRILSAGDKLPYFLRDNQEIYQKILDIQPNKPIVHIVTAQERSAIRHAARTPQDIADIQARWNAKLFRDTQTKKHANMALELAKNWNEIDYSELKQMIAENNLSKMSLETKKVMTALKAMRSQERALEDYLHDVHRWHKKHSLAELKSAHNSVKGTMDYYKTKFGADIATDSNLEKLKSELEYKIKFVENPGKYKTGLKPKATWQVEQDAYLQILDKVETRIDILDKQKIYTALTKFKTTSKDYKKFLEKAKEALDAGDIKKAELYLNNAKYKKNSLEAKRQAKISKAIAINRSKTLDALYSGGSPFTSEEITKIQDFEDQIIQSILDYGHIDDNLNTRYHNYILQLSEKYYSKQISLYRTAEQETLKKATEKYLSRPKTNPKYVWGADVGGVYTGRYQKRHAYLKKLKNGITADELSIVQRFTNGSTFSNAYNLRHSSTYWAKKWKEKMDMLTPSQVEEMEQIIEEWSQGANYTLNRMVRYNGLTFRGLDSGGGSELRAQLTKAFNNKTTWINEASCSTSMKFSVASNFDGDLILVIHNKTGAYIHEMSDYSSEFEIMTLRGTKYRVIKPPTKVGSKWFAEIEEI